MLAIKGAIVTIDAMGCQKAIGKQAINSGADYIFAVKVNQPALCGEVETFFEKATTNASQKSSLSCCEEANNGHRRKERRFIWASSEILWMNEKSKWSGIESIGMIASERILEGRKTTFDTRFFISSLPADVAVIGKAMRTHWQLENSLHWTLDVAFRDDECGVRKGYGAENFATLRHIALNLIKKRDNG